MTAEPPRRVLGEQRGPGQLGQRGPRLGQRDRRERGRRGGRDVGPVVQAEQPEHPRGLVAELVGRPGEDRPQVGRLLAGPQRVEAAPRVGQLGGEVGEPQGGAGHRPGAGHAQRERQPRGVLDDRRHRRRLGLRALGAEPAGDKLGRLPRVEHVKRHRAGTLHDEPGQLRPAGHQHHAAGTAGQQRPHLVRVVRVVEEQQHPLAVEQRAQQRALRLKGGRHVRGGNPERVEEPLQRGGRLHRRARRVEPAQVHVQLAVGEQPVPPAWRTGSRGSSCPRPRSP